MSERRRDLFVALVGVMLCLCVYLGAFYHIYYSVSPEIMVVEIFDSYHHTYKNGDVATEIWTYGYGKFHFIGNHTFLEDHSYWIQYIETPRSTRSHVWLKVLDYKEVGY